MESYNPKSESYNHVVFNQYVNEAAEYQLDEHQVGIIPTTTGHSTSPQHQVTNIFTLYHVILDLLSIESNLTQDCVASSSIILYTVFLLFPISVCLKLTTPSVFSS